MILLPNQEPLRRKNLPRELPEIEGAFAASNRPRAIPRVDGQTNAGKIPARFPRLVFL
jgi:hypothetical protein